MYNEPEFKINRIPEKKPRQERPEHVSPLLEALENLRAIAIKQLNVVREETAKKLTAILADQNTESRALSIQEQAAVASISAEFGLQTSNSSQIEAIASQETLGSIADLRASLKQRTDQIFQPLMVTEINELLQVEGFNGGIDQFLAAIKGREVLESISALGKVFEVLCVAAVGGGRQACIEIANKVLAAISRKKIPKESGRQLVELLRNLQSASHTPICKDNVPVVLSAYDDPRYRFVSFSFQEAGLSITSRKRGTSSRFFDLQFTSDTE